MTHNLHATLRARHTYTNACKAKNLDYCCVATDDPRIQKVAGGYRWSFHALRSFVAYSLGTLEGFV